MKLCARCGKENDDNAKYCKHCGIILEEGIHDSERKNESKKKAMWAIVAIIILIVSTSIYLTKAGKTTASIKNKLISEEWQVYYAYNSYNEELIAPELFGNGVRYMNRLSFYEDGRFELVLSSYTNSSPDGMMTGTYDCNGTVVTLNSEFSDEIIELNYKTLEHKNYEDVEALCWNVHMMDLYGNEDDYRIYFSSPEFFD